MQRSRGQAESEKMITKITKIEKDKPELVEIYCHTITDEVKSSGEMSRP